MFQFIAGLIQLVVIILFFGLSLILLLISIFRRKNRDQFVTFIASAFVSLAVAIFILNFNLATSESSDEENIRSTLEHRFEFTIPSSANYLNAKMFALYDTEKHWVEIGCTKKEFNEIIMTYPQYTLLETNSNIIKEINSEDDDRPSWFKYPTNNQPPIYRKTDFLNHTFSESIIFYNLQQEKAFVILSYFD